MGIPNQVLVFLSQTISQHFNNGILCPQELVAAKERIQQEKINLPGSQIPRSTFVILHEQILSRPKQLEFGYFTEKSMFCCKGNGAEHNKGLEQFVWAAIGALKFPLEIPGAGSSLGSRVAGIRAGIFWFFCGEIRGEGEVLGAWRSVTLMCWAYLGCAAHETLIFMEFWALQKIQAHCEGFLSGFFFWVQSRPFSSHLLPVL